MGILVSFRRKFGKFVAGINCWVNGHLDIKILESYEAEKRALSFAGRSLENLRAKKPYLETKTVNKCACRSCGQIFLKMHTNRTDLL